MVLLCIVGLGVALTRTVGLVVGVGRIISKGWPVSAVLGMPVGIVVKNGRSVVVEVGFAIL